MQILSDTDLDVRSKKINPGSYEWWYFDAVSSDEVYSIVVIFYDGNPFSRRYLDALQNDKYPLAEQYPAISLSVYRDGKPVFYSFEEVKPGEADFSARKPEGHVKKNTFQREIAGQKLCYRLSLDQTVPNGDQLKGELVFESILNPIQIQKSQNTRDQGHRWNLVQPQAKVQGTLQIRGFKEETISFSGLGYHDHNTGNEPLRDSFEDWYWGRLHFGDRTLIYYLMNENDEYHSNGWIIGPGGEILFLDDGIETDDFSVNLFGLKSARKIEKKHGDIRFLIQKNSIIDDGPFYQRFFSRLMLQMDDSIYQGSGISEYISPARIHNKLFRPLVNMRIQYPDQEHWVQKSPRLYRWTW
ncbi:hypothetical protein DYD21_12205 [Rhodohalobacter sp. SW132]|uniref:hypothetical protein n=1 Tax=Rhodohalobacter sp. SW132 TaxID=2293433 RepID=UPI000E222A90|nr:hypothetical protein [Rhodohalobacter sp. SW132]REL33018.1 hypothetical protein DYD21_12205 [Rhodohalobacter sp. SW132]